MIKLFKNGSIPNFIFLGFLALTLSCTDKPIDKKTETAALQTDGTFYIDNVYKKNNQRYAVIDMIEYENRTDSIDQNKQNKIDLPNGYYIINEKIEPIEIIVADSVIITMQTLNYDEYGNFKFNEKIKFDDLIKTYNMLEIKRYKHIPFKIVFSNNRIIAITEIYIP